MTGVWGGCGAAARKGGLLARKVLRGATWGVVSSRLANCRVDAEKPASGGPGGLGGKEALDATG
jgi:hypothetical protein